MGSAAPSIPDILAVIASAAKQSSFARAVLDCFAALAMTKKGGNS